VKAGDFLVSRRQIVHGGCGIVPHELDGAIVSNEYLVLHATNQLVQEYLEWLSNSVYFQQTCFHSSIGVHVEKMVFKPEWWLKFRFHIPTIPEQRIIAEILSSCDFTIKKTEQLITAKEKRYAYLLKNLINQRNVKNGWRIVKLGDVFAERKETKHNDLPLLSITREEGVIPREDVDRKDTSNADKSKYLRICPGDIGYNTMRMWQGVSALSSFEGIVSPAYTICTPTDEVNGQFMAYLFKVPYIIHLFYRYSKD